MTEQFRLKAALDVVELDQTTFENAVAKGDYTSIPPTSRGAARLFNEDNLVALWIFARLIEARGDHARERMSLKEAGKVVRRIDEVIREHPNAEHVYVVTHVNDLIRAYPGDQLDLMKLLRGGVSSGVMIRDIRIWDVRNVRELIRKSIAAEGAA